MHKNEPIGVIGVGLLGSALATRLVEQNFAVQGFDTSPNQLEKLEQKGGLASRTAEEIFKNCSQVLLSLPNSQIVSELLDQCRNALRPGTVIIDTTTGKPSEMEETGRFLEERQVNYVEATVAGSSAQVELGEVSLFLGGDDKVLEQVEPIFNALAGTIFKLGPVGSASRFKLVHNLVLGLNRAVLAEGLAFAERLGFDALQVLEILEETPAASRVMQTKGRKMARQDRTPQARLSQHLKDVRLILAEAIEHSAHTPLSNLHRELLEAAEASGLGDLDNSAIIEVFRK